jgi:hypothetical protein
VNPMDESPPEINVYATADVTLHYADGGTRTGYLDYWTGWMRWSEDGTPQAVEDDDEQPVGWSVIGGGR